MSFSSSTNCVFCATQPSITSCEGCQRKLCLSCLTKHRNELSLELDDLFNRRNELVESINNNLPNKATDKCSYFDEINRWQNEMHTNIDRIASTARDNVRQFVLEASKNVRIELDQISQDLQQKQKTGGYVEGDLNRIKQQLIKLTSTVQRFNEQIRIDTTTSKNINWDSLVFVIPNRESQTNTKATVVPPSPKLYSSFDQKSNNRMSMPYPQYTSSPTSISHSTNTYRPTGRSASVSMGSRPLTYTCIGCKTTNVLTENGRNFCSVCRCAAPF